MGRIAAALAQSAWLLGLQFLLACRVQAAEGSVVAWRGTSLLWPSLATRFDHDQSDRSATLHSVAGRSGGRETAKRNFGRVDLNSSQRIALNRSERKKSTNSGLSHALSCHVMSGTWHVFCTCNLSRRANNGHVRAESCANLLRFLPAAPPC